MKLNVYDRVMLLNILPTENNFLTMKLIQELKDDLGFSEKELKKLNFKQDDTGINWNPDVEIVKDIKIGDTMKQIIKEELKKLDEEKRLTTEHLDVYEMFVG